MLGGLGISRIDGVKFHLVEKLRRLRNLYRLLGNGFMDALKFARHSSLGGRLTKEDQYFAALTMYYHGIEKGMTLPSPRPLFGKALISRILATLKLYRRQFGYGQAGNLAINALSRYIAFNESLVQPDPSLVRLRSELEKLKQSSAYDDRTEALGGITFFSKDEVLADAKCDLTRFFQSRHSVRDFSDDPVDVDLIVQAVAMARTTPSVCNRQPYRACVLTEKPMIESVLSHQNGNQGFGDKVDKLLVVVGNMAAFIAPAERHELWVDGGMFAMSLVYALHSLGLATCCLNWSAGCSDDRYLRKDLGLRAGELVVMMIAVGNLPHNFRVCQSTRKPMDDMMVVI